MSGRLLIRASCLGLLAATPAYADGFPLPGFGAQPPAYARPGYRETEYPPLQHDVLGRAVLPPSPYDRPSYRQENNAFPPPAGRYGGGFIEYVMTGGRPEPLPAASYPAATIDPGPHAYPAPRVYQAPPQAYAAPVDPGPAAALPVGGLPDYRPQPQAFFGNAASVVVNTPFSAAAAEPAAVGRQIDPMYSRQDVSYSGGERPGTIIIDTPEKFLFLVQPGGRAIRYGIGVGRPGFTWAGIKTISRKAEWPAWTPPSEMMLRRPDLPRHMAGGIGNPLGARALYLGSSLYRIHGTNEPWTIGTNVSSGCIRMMNEDVEDIYGRVRVGTRVVVL